MVAFVIKYQDGSLAEIDIDEHTLARGRHVVPTICRERQERFSRSASRSRYAVYRINFSWWSHPLILAAPQK